MYVIPLVKETPMRKFSSLAILLTLTSSVAMAQSISVDNFHSYNKPISFKMAKASEMADYRKDLDNYVKSIDASIELLLQKRNDAIHDYNEGVREYNREDFFHKDRVPYYPKRTGAIIDLNEPAYEPPIIIAIDNGDDIDYIHKKINKEEPKGDRFDQMMADMKRRMGY